ncbi:MAG TPA: FAD-dependent oxidoreductase, partial [Glycomyces sp.]|nr:FAD-dependent oxidoreductase [Glycomyces sp.]
MQHRIVVLGAGYAGSYAAGYLARHLHRDDFAVTVVNAEPEFVERLRLHQVAAGQNLRRYELAKIFADSGARLRLGRVSAIDADNKTVTIADEYGIELIEYDTLLYALGSTAADHGVPGVDEHAFHIAARPAALRLRDRLDQLERRGKADGNGTVLVVGGNLTAIEAATEFAESRPGLRIRLATRGELGGWLGPKARRHLMRAFDRFGIDVHEHTAIEQVTATGAVAADGTVFPADAVVW